MTRSLKSILIVTLLGLAPASFAADPDIERFATEFLALCPGTGISQKPWTETLPQGLTGTIIELEADQPWCGGQYLAVRTANGKLFLGHPWLLRGRKGSTEEKIRAFAWDNLQQNLTVEPGGTRSPEGLSRVSAFETTEYGRVPMVGLVDATGTIFFPGYFYSIGNPAKERLDLAREVIATAPMRGAAGSDVLVLEFSDFQCPSCKRVSPVVKELIEAYGERIEYRRIDLPIFGMHPWALPASVIGRAIHRQSPEAFWAYKDAVYENQAELNTFVIEDFAFGFAEGQSLDLEKLRGDLAAGEIRSEILKAVGIASDLQVRGTPTFWVNGRPVDFGEDGEGLKATIDAALK
ncbi:MAG TPA: thioredoxin domain-containing protein [Thermoanaerobaculia bacterium]|nr:thioredoxin domain-containing protein [Thermoanaerobaculia bacterium]